MGIDSDLLILKSSLNMQNGALMDNTEEPEFKLKLRGLTREDEISQKGMVVIRIIAITWLIAQSNKSSYLEGRREGYRYYPGVKIFW
jgi:hypothetical protein